MSSNLVVLSGEPAEHWEVGTYVGEKCGHGGEKTGIKTE